MALLYASLLPAQALASTLKVDGELFWGFDDFRHLELFLAGEDPLDREALVRWGQLRPTARRRIGRDKPA